MESGEETKTCDGNTIFNNNDVINNNESKLSENSEQQRIYNLLFGIKKLHSPIITKNTVFKSCCKKEMKMWQILEGSSIVPKCVLFPQHAENLLCTKTYPTTLADYFENKKDMNISNTPYLLKKVQDLVFTLHSQFQILHGDLHIGNIVFDPSTEDMRLIDFEHACLVTELEKEHKREFYYKFWGLEMEEHSMFETPEDVLVYERELKILR